MKKSYNTPICITADIEAQTVLCTSPLSDTDATVNGYNYSDIYEELD